MNASAGAVLQQKLASVWSMLDERTRRLVAANEALALGYGGVSRVHRACGLSRAAIATGIREIEEGVCLEPGRVRRPGAGRKRIAVSDPALLVALDRLIDPDTRGDPESPLRWVCKSTRTLAEVLRRQQHPISHVKIAELLHDQGYSLQSNRKIEEGGDHPDRDAQFRHINARVTRALAAKVPVISVDTKTSPLPRFDPLLLCRSGPEEKHDHDPCRADQPSGMMHASVRRERSWSLPLWGEPGVSTFRSVGHLYY